MEVATPAELMPGLKVTDDKVAVGSYTPFVNLVDDREKLPRFALRGNAAAPDSLEELLED
jgi:hypothetical protein